MIMTKKEKQARKESAIVHLRSILKPGDTINTVLLTVSRSGMSRRIKPLFHAENGILDLSYWVNGVFEQDPENKGPGVRMDGAGMDMGFALVNNLSYRLFHEYKCPGKGCPSADHVNSPRKPYRKGTNHKDGYALKQRWL